MKVLFVEEVALFCSLIYFFNYFERYKIMYSTEINDNTVFDNAHIFYDANSYAVYIVKCNSKYAGVNKLSLIYYFRVREKLRKQKIV